jgi:response regulator RpfG family c-di-GMP phosphodiesterase
MLELTKISKIMIFLGILSILISVFVNYYFFNHEQQLMAKTTEIVEHINNESIQIDLSLRVLNNIIQQLPESSTASDLPEALSDPYFKNRDYLEEQLIYIKENLEEFERLIDQSNLHIFRSYTENNQRLHAYAEDIATSANWLQKYSQQALTSQQYKSNSTAQMEYNVLRENISALSQLQKNVYNQAINYARLMVNSVFAILVFFVLFLSVIILKLLNKNIRYLTESIQLVERNDFDSNKLPSYSPLFAEDAHVIRLVTKIMDENAISNNIKNIVINTYDMDDMLHELFKIFNQFLNIDRIGVCFYDSINNTLIAESGVSKYSNILLGPGFSIHVEESSLLSIIKTKKGRINNDLEIAYKQKPHSKPLELITREGIQSNMSIPLLINNEVFGILFFSSTYKNHFTKDHLRHVTKIVNEISGFFNRAYLLKMVFSRFTYSFSSLVNERDYETGGHLDRMTRYSELLAEKLRQKALPTHEVHRHLILDIQRYAALHDIGKVAIPDHILKKPGKFEEHEWDIMKTHVNVGQNIFSELRHELKMFNKDFFKVAENIIAYHHERWDGKGYPYGLKDYDIPLEARIVALGDVFDALTSKRVYKKAFTIDEALSIIQESKGTHFDPVLVDILLENLDSVLAIYKTQDTAISASK